MDDASTPSARIRDGNQTLARGLRVMLEIADSGVGMSVQQVCELLDVHRSIAYRLLQTLVDFGLAAKTEDRLYIPGARMATLSGAAFPMLRNLAEPVMRSVADKLRSTVLLFVQQGTEALAISIIEPTTATYHIAFRPGMRTPLNRGASGYALLAYGPPKVDEPAAVTTAREVGFARSQGEIRSDAFAVSAWIQTKHSSVPACLSIITYTEAIADRAGKDIRRAADKIGNLIDRADQQLGTA